MNSISNRKNIVVDILLASIWLSFLYRTTLVLLTGFNFNLLVFALIESIVIVSFLLRNPHSNISHKPFDWFVAFVGTFIPTTFSLTAGGSFVYLGDMIISIGAILALSSYISLNTSFGIVAANRGIKKGGMFRFVRHPIYASALIVNAGYVLGHTSTFNISIILCWLVFTIFRIRAEEKVLLMDPEYESYSKKTAWKMLPFIY